MNTQYLADEVFNEFDRLGVSTNQEAYSGFMTEYENLVVEGRPDITVIGVYDDYAYGMYDAKAVLGYLKTLSPEEVSLDNQSPQNVWQHIQAFEL